jgi:uncharacterized RDD family membrane protein YckC
MFGGPGRRAVAALIDLCIVGAAMLLSLPLPGYLRGVLPPLPADVPLMLLPLVVPLLYFIVFPATRVQATPGKRACGLKIATLGGDRIGLFRSLVRFVASLLSIAALFLGDLAMVWSRKHRAFHDLVAGTVVGEAKSRAPEIAWSQPPAPSWTGRIVGTLAYAAVIGLLVLLYQSSGLDYAALQARIFQ